MKLQRITTLLSFLLGTLFLSLSYADEIYSKTQQANRLYKQGNFEEALKLYEDALLLSPSDEKLKMNKGSAQYQLGDFESAEQSYLGALSAEEKKVQATAHYNMGNILYRKGDMLQQQGDPSKAQEQYKKALEHYIQSLKLKSTDFDAKWNLQCAHQRIQQMEQQKQQQQQNKNDKNQDQKDQQNQNNQNKDRQDKQQQQDKQENNNDEKKDNQEQKDQQQQNNQKDKQQQQQQQTQEQKEDDMKKEEAKRLLELYADDADSLNKPPKKGIGQQRQPERDW